MGPDEFTTLQKVFRNKWSFIFRWLLWNTPEHINALSKAVKQWFQKPQGFLKHHWHRYLI